MQKIVIRHLTGARANQVDEFSMAAVKELIIGREASASIRFDPDRDDLVSRQHAKVQLDSSDAESLQLVDLQSRNGTFLNRQRVYGAIRINHNDVVQLGAGGPEFRLEMDPPPSGAARPTRQASLDTLGRLGSKATREAWPSAIAGAPAVSGVPAVGPRPVGRGTVERMLGEAFGHVKRETNRLTWVGIAALVAIVAVGGGIRYYLRESATAQAAAQEQNIQTLQRMNEELKKNPAAAESMKQQIARLESELERSDQRHTATVQALLKEVEARVARQEQMKAAMASAGIGVESTLAPNGGQIADASSPAAPDHSLDSSSTVPSRPPPESVKAPEPARADAQTMNFTPEQINAAIGRGTQHAGQQLGLLLSDTASQLGQALGMFASSQGTLQPGVQVSASGFQVRLFTPLEWIAQQASDAVGSGHSFTQGDVNDDMLRPVLRIRAIPSTPPDVGPNYGIGVASVAKVFVKDAAKKDEVDAESTAPFDYQNLQGLTAEFPMSEIARLREGNPEFHVFVVGSDGGQKDFKVKKKHFARLP